MFEVKAFECEHCRKISRHKQSMRQHEKRCYHNPETRSCVTCHIHNYSTCEYQNDGLKTNCKHWKELRILEEELVDE